MELIRATQNGITEFGRAYKKGEFLPFYIPRPDMPQVDEKDLPICVHTAVVDTAHPTFEVVNPVSLHAHQRVDKHMAQTMPENIRMKPVLVSADNFILDGNHRWWAHMYEKSTAMNIIRIGLAFDAAIDWLFKQPYTYKITPTTEVRN